VYLLVIEPSTLLDLTIKHDSIKIYQSLSPTPTICLKTLAESGSFKILRHLAESQSIYLHLENYHPPRLLPEDFEFFWMHGYRYLPASHFLSMACENGRDDILKFLYQLNSNILVPSKEHQILAAKNGHLNVLKWALDHDLEACRANIGLALVTNDHFKAFEQLQERLQLFMPIMNQNILVIRALKCLNL
jgi:hypothetical protein